MSIQRSKPLSYYSIGSTGQWLRFAIAVVDQAAAVLCWRQWQPARVHVAAPESHALAGRRAAHRGTDRSRG